MSKKVRLSEEDLIKLIGRVIKEQTEGFDFKLSRSSDDATREATLFDEIYLKKNGDTYDVYAQGRKDNAIVFKNYTIPKESDLVVKFDSDTKTFLSEGPTIEGNLIAKMISTGMKMSQGNWVVYTKEDGVPAIGKMMLGPTLPVEYFVQKGKSRKKLTPDQTFSLNDYFVNSKNKKEARGFIMEEISDAEKV